MNYLSLSSAHILLLISLTSVFLSLKIGNTYISKYEETGVTPLEAFSEFRREVWIMSSLSHPCLCGLVGFCIYPPCIVCEFVDKGDLYSFVHRTRDDPKYEEISVSLRLRMALDIALGMRYLHTRDPPIIHR